MIYLLRHFKVIDKSENIMDSDRFDYWVEAYDSYTLAYADIKLPLIDEVYCSTMQRCARSADYLKTNSILRDELIEVDSKAAFKTPIKLPKSLWLMIDRFLWYFNLSHHENRRETIQRADAFIDTLDVSKDILIISHGLFLNVLCQRLKLRGYDGEVGILMKNAQVYKLKKREIK